MRYWTFWVNDGRMQSLNVGEWVDINGERWRVVALTMIEATEDDPELGVKVGDLVTTVEFGDDDAP